MANEHKRNRSYFNEMRYEAHFYTRNCPEAHICTITTLLCHLCHMFLSSYLIDLFLLVNMFIDILIIIVLKGKKKH